MTASTETPAPRTEPVPIEAARASFKYYDLVMAGFVTIILCSNLIAPGKSARVMLSLKRWLAALALLAIGHASRVVRRMFGCSLATANTNVKCLLPVITRRMADVRTSGTHFHSRLVFLK